jgi:acetyltransferase
MRAGLPMSKGPDHSPQVRAELTHSPLAPFFAPCKIAVIGAEERPGSVGRAILSNLVSGQYAGSVHPVTPNHKSVLGIPAYASIADVAGAELAIVTAPAPTVPAIVAECSDAGVKSVLVISGGFRECGSEGAILEQELVETARRGRVRIIGPNCLGVMRPSTGLNATYARQTAKAGSVAFVSQSGALCSAVLDWSLRENVGFSAFVSIGHMADVNWGDLIDYLGDDPHTHSILLYIESIGDARSFVSAARQVARSKPIIAIKAGRTAAGARAAASHTGAMTGSDEVAEAAFRRCGVLRVGTIADLFYMAEVLGKQPRPGGPRLGIVTNAGGLGVLAADGLLLSRGELAQFSDDTMRALDELLPPHWSHANPADLLNDATPEQYASATKLVAADPNTDGVLLILAPQALTDATRTAQQVAESARGVRKPVLASWMGGNEVAAGEQILNAADIPTFPYPDTAARVFTYMWQHSRNLNGLYETPVASADDSPHGPDADDLVQAAARDGRTLLDEAESKRVLAAYGIPVNEAVPVTTADDAVRAAEAIGYPVVVKLLSHTIAHKGAAGGVHLNLIDEAAVRDAFARTAEAVTRHHGPGVFLGVTVQRMITGRGCELIVGSAVDPQFGPVLLFGLGGELTETLRDRALGIPPLTTTLARRLMERTRAFRALAPAEGHCAGNLEGLEQLLVRFSQLVVEQRRIREIDVNPLFASRNGLIALDARIVLHPPEVPDTEIPKPAIRPYPSQYVRPFRMRDGRMMLIRPIRPEDEPLMVEFHQSLSAPSVYQRYMHPFKLSHRIAHERLSRLCFIDYDREMALVAEVRDPSTGPRKIAGIGRLTRMAHSQSAEFAIVISDLFQKQGIGSELLRQLIDLGRSEGIRSISGHILTDNYDMQRLCERAGFRLERALEDPVVTAVLDLT